MREHRSGADFRDRGNRQPNRLLGTCDETCPSPRAPVHSAASLRRPGTGRARRFRRTNASGTDGAKRMDGGTLIPSTKSKPRRAALRRARVRVVCVLSGVYFFRVPRAEKVKINIARRRTRATSARRTGTDGYIVWCSGRCFEKRESTRAQTDVLRQQIDFIRRRPHPRQYNYARQNVFVRSVGPRVTRRAKFF